LIVFPDSTTFLKSHANKIDVPATTNNNNLTRIKSWISLDLHGHKKGLHRRSTDNETVENEKACTIREIYATDNV